MTSTYPGHEVRSPFDLRPGTGTRSLCACGRTIHTRPDMWRIGIFIGISVLHRSEVASVTVTQRMQCISLLLVAPRRDAMGAVTFSRANFRLLCHGSRFNNRNGNRYRNHVVKALPFDEVRDSHIGIARVNNPSPLSLAATLVLD